MLTLRLDNSVFIRTGNSLFNVFAEVNLNNVESRTDYELILHDLSQQVLTELSFLTEYEANNLLKRFGLISERIDNSFETLRKHYHLFKQDLFEASDFEEEFFPFYNLPKPTVGGLSLDPSQSFSLTNFIADLAKAIQEKQRALEWITSRLQVIHNLNERPDPNDEQSLVYNQYTIDFNSETQDQLYNSLMPHLYYEKGTPTDQVEKTKEIKQQNLRQVLAGHPLADPVVLSCKQNVLGFIFYNQYVNKKSITESKERVLKWLHKNFRRIESGKEHNYSISTLRDHLKGKNLPYSLLKRYNV
jgi:hypothetical protein